MAKKAAAKKAAAKKATATPYDLPSDVIAWVKGVFHECDRRVTGKLSNNPNLPEEQFDLTWIEHLSHCDSPVTLPSSWLVQIETHFLGGMRHFYGRWEIADIGVLLFIKKAGRVQRSKVALLQSKRLYPTNERVTADHPLDYEIGFARLADPEDLNRSIAFQTDYEFKDDCRYGAMEVGSDQYKAIESYEEAQRLAVYYQFFNPWRVPYSQVVPRVLTGKAKTKPELVLGTRVMPARLLHEALKKQAKGYKPTLRDLAGLLDEPHEYGWPLDHFVAELFLQCREGTPFDRPSDAAIQSLFYRRSGAISAAIAITIEEP
jgi:hypothetical protein